VLSHQRIIEFLCVAAPKVVGGILLIFVNIMLMRFFEPAQYGVYSLCATSILLIDLIIGSAVDMGVLRLAPIYRPKDYGRSVALEFAGIILKLVFAATLLILAFLFADHINNYLFEQAGDTNVIYLTALGGSAMLLLRSTLVHLQIEQRFTLYGLVEWVHNIAKYGAILIVLAVFIPSPMQILLIFAVAPALACVLGYWFMHKKLAHTSWRGHKGVHNELFNLVKWYTLTIIVGTLISRMDIYFIGMLSGVDQVGIFSAALIIALVPEILGTYLAAVFNPRIMHYWQERRFYPLFRRVQITLYAVAILLFMLALMVVEHLGYWLIPSDYAQAVDIFQILLLGTLAGMFTYPLTVSFLMFVRPKLLLQIDCTAFPFIIVAYLYAIDHQGLIGAAWVTALSRFIRALVAQVVAWQVARAH